MIIVIILGDHDKKPLVNTKNRVFFFWGIFDVFFFQDIDANRSERGLIPASPETITSDSAAQLTGGDPWIDGLEGMNSLYVFINPGNTLDFGFQYPEFCVRFCLFIFSSSTIYMLFQHVHVSIQLLPAQNVANRPRRESSAVEEKTPACST